jgi:hypothetical protein
MNLAALKKYLDDHGAEEGFHYVIDALGDGEVHGIAQEDGTWYTYYSERGSRRDKHPWGSEAEACAQFRDLVMDYMQDTGDWKPAAGDEEDIWRV